MSDILRVAKVGVAKVLAAAINGGLSGIAVHQLLDGATWHVFIAAAGAAALPVAQEAAKRLQQAAKRTKYPDPWATD